MSNLENEQMYLDMVNQLKVKYDEMEYTIQKMKKNDLDQKKIIWTCYGILRIVDITLQSDEEFTQMLIQSLRGMLSEIFDDWSGIYDE
tara:strand:- start:2033 stop:2296 length:264 start_codon:yes stop_codon:yes gene_type:complete